jgi:hypothetical protein
MAALAGTLLFLTTLGARAQMGGAPGINAALPLLFGDHKAFSAKASIRVLDKDSRETMRCPMDFALLDNKVRVDIDITQMKGKMVEGQDLSGLKQMGMEKLSSVFRPDRKEIVIIYPGLEACMVNPLPAEDLTALEKPPKITRTDMGKETIDGHSCSKIRLTMTDAGKHQTEAFVWEASDLNNFPVQIQTTEKTDTLIMRFSNVKTDKPDATRFEMPKGYKKYSSPQEMMQGAAAKLMGAGR